MLTWAVLIVCVLYLAVLSWMAFVENADGRGLKLRKPSTEEALIYGVMIVPLLLSLWHAAAVLAG